MRVGFVDVASGCYKCPHCGFIAMDFEVLHQHSCAGWNEHKRVAERDWPKLALPVHPRRYGVKCRRPDSEHNES